MTDPHFKVLFLCTSNASRSILAEAQMNALGHGAFRAYSAGSRPSEQVDPMTIDYLQNLGLPVEELRSKSWDEFSALSTQAIDYVITLCDDAAGETFPAWPGHPISAHWGVGDPLAAGTSDDEKRLAIRRAAAALHKRIELFMALPTQTLDRMSLQAHMDDIGRTA